ncbi:probable serine/threonine-protein kinase clkA [Ixodes scapularis]|uniref:probable serine/threonine-protein kinase clkA n=1 Tax=Ixodes scapularis TaxID=6945 RepID=UPI001C38793F|nr:probable serine/threonine-protein kinase clkA [Ixodes scapularis]
MLQTMFFSSLHYRNRGLRLHTRGGIAHCSIYHWPQEFPQVSTPTTQAHNKGETNNSQVIDNNADQKPHNIKNSGISDKIFIEINNYSRGNNNGKAHYKGNNTCKNYNNLENVIYNNDSKADYKAGYQGNNTGNGYNNNADYRGKNRGKCYYNTKNKSNINYNNDSKADYKAGYQGNNTGNGYNNNADYRGKNRGKCYYNTKNKSNINYNNDSKADYKAGYQGNNTGNGYNNNADYRGKNRGKCYYNTKNKSNINYNNDSKADYKADYNADYQGNNSGTPIAKKPILCTIDTQIIPRPQDGVCDIIFYETFYLHGGGSLLDTSQGKFRSFLNYAANYSGSTQYGLAIPHR